MALGQEFFTDINNELTFTVTEEGSNTVSVSANIFQTSGGKQVQLDWKPPYLDIHQNSLMHVPFNYNSYRVGNNLDYEVNFSDKNFHTPFVFHNKEVEVDFKSSHAAKDQKRKKVIMREL
jgi:hypothetical protein